MRVLSAIQPSFFPWLGYFYIIKKSDVFIFYDHVQYDKNGWRNRNKIIINGQPRWITLPINKGNLKKKITDVELYNSKKNLNKIYKTIFYNYKNKKNFEKVMQLISQIFFCKEWDYLSNLNIEITKRICDYLNINTEMYESSKLDNVYDKNLNLIKLCKKFNCDIYLSGTSAKSYIDENKFNSFGIKVKWSDFDEKNFVKDYRSDKIFQNMSILDYIFNNDLIL